jgi:hypothetical protein
VGPTLCSLLELLDLLRALLCLVLLAGGSLVLLLGHLGGLALGFFLAKLGL